MLFGLISNIWNLRLLQHYFRFAIVIFILFLFHWTWFPIKVATTSGMHCHFYNGTNMGEMQQASDAYRWTISILFGAWVFYGYNASSHLAEEALPGIRGGGERDLDQHVQRVVSIRADADRHPILLAGL
jgi:hypothetical protein